MVGGMRPSLRYCSQTPSAADKVDILSALALLFTVVNNRVNQLGSSKYLWLTSSSIIETEAAGWLNVVGMKDACHDFAGLEQNPTHLPRNAATRSMESVLLVVLSIAITFPIGCLRSYVSNCTCLSVTVMTRTHARDGRRTPRSLPLSISRGSRYLSPQYSLFFYSSIRYEFGR